MSFILAIDPGLGGALAIVTKDYSNLLQLVAVYDMPIANNELNPHELARLIEIWKPQHAYIERVSSMPRDGVVSAFKFGAVYATARTVVAMLDIPITLVTPTQWKRIMKVSGGPAGKEQCRNMALQMFPGSAIHFSRKKDHGRAEAALLAAYGLQQQR